MKNTTKYIDKFIEVRNVKTGYYDLFCSVTDLANAIGVTRKTVYDGLKKTFTRSQWRFRAVHAEELIDAWKNREVKA